MRGDGSDAEREAELSVYSDALWEFKRSLLLRVLRKHRGSASAAGLELGVHRNTISRLVAETRISPAGVRREFRERPTVKPPPSCREAARERDPAISKPEYVALEGAARVSYRRKKPVLPVRGNEMDPKMWELIRKLGP